MVVDPELVQDGCVKVADGDGIFDHAVTEFIGIAVAHAAADNASGKNRAVTLDVVITSGALGHGSASEFSTPDDERVLEQIAILEVRDESRGAAVEAERLGGTRGDYQCREHEECQKTHGKPDETYYSGKILHHWRQICDGVVAEKHENLPKGRSKIGPSYMARGWISGVIEWRKSLRFEAALIIV